MTDPHRSRSALADLVQLQYDSLFFFDAAVRGVQDEGLRSMLSTLRGEHASNLAELQQWLRDEGTTPPETESLRGLGVESRVAGASLVGDDAVLDRLVASEDDLVEAYARAASDRDLPDSLRERLNRTRDEELGHRESMRRWLAANV
jgi:uncharacterized protein (TIGR02284 family)